MKAEIGRRVFVGSVGAGLPLLARASMLAQGGGSPAHDHTAVPADPVIDYIVRQIAVIHNSARTAPHGEHLRALAAQLRTLSVYERQVGMDDEVRRQLSDLVAQQGRNAVLYAEPDILLRREHLQQYGFRLDERVLNAPVPVATHEQRESALEDLLRNGITPTFDRMAVAAEGAARGLDARPGRVIGIAQDDQWWMAFCSELLNQYQDAQWNATVYCLIAKYFTPMLPSCMALEGGAMVLFLAYLYECWQFI